MAAGASRSSLGATVLAIALVCGATGGCGDDSSAAPDATPDAAAPDIDAAVDADLPDSPPPADASGPDAEVLGPLGAGVATLTGSSTPDFVDGPRGTARFDNPVNVLGLADGTLIVADFDNGRLRRVTADGTVTTLPTVAGFDRPFGLAVSPDGMSVYVGTDRDTGGGLQGALWRVSLATGVPTSVLNAIGRPRGLAFLGDGRLAMSFFLDHVVRIYDPVGGSVADLAGNPGVAGFAEGTGTAALFNQPYDLAVDADGNLLCADGSNHRIRLVTLAGVVTTFAGSGTLGSGDGALLEATFNFPQGLARAADGTLYVSDPLASYVRKIAGGQVTTIAGTGLPGYLDATDPLMARLYGLEGISLSGDEMVLYLADGDRGGDTVFHHRIRRLTLP